MTTESVAPPRVLVAEPHDETRLVYCSLFGQAGCDVVDASDGRDALAKALVRAPAIVLTELQLPGLDGVALCEILRRDRVTARVPILVVTARMKDAELDRVRTLADAVLFKPASPAAVISRAQALMARADAAHARSAALRSDSASERRHAATLREASHAPRLQSEAQRASLRRRHRRFDTSAPPLVPPILQCPRCDRQLTYVRSHVGGVSAHHPEQWDDYLCVVCGAFEYRHRTRKLRQLHPSR